MITPARSTSGAMVLVVGPSGAGKDTLMLGARAALAGDDSFVFARRVVTRTAAHAAEDHDIATPEAFEDTVRQGGFLLHWRAHGLGYGIPVSVTGPISAGKVVIANVSRGAIAEAERLVERVVVLHVTAPLDVLAKRIADRGRESAEAAAARIARQAPITASRAEVVEILNVGPVDEAVARFVEALRRVSGP